MHQTETKRGDGGWEVKMCVKSIVKAGGCSFQNSQEIEFWSDA